MQNFISFLYTQLSREPVSHESSDTNIVSTEYWRIVTEGKPLEIKIVCNFQQPPFFMTGDCYLPDRFLNQFEQLCQELLLHKTPEKLQSFVQRIQQFQGGV